MLKQDDIDTPEWLSNFISTYENLSKTNLWLLPGTYHKDVVFVDPMHQIEGIEALQAYFEHLYTNLSFCNFNIERTIVEDNQAAVYWVMTYQHPKLNNGQTVTVHGNSHLKGEKNKIIYHRDYLDLGAMLYEQIPVFGRLTQWIKQKARQ